MGILDGEHRGKNLIPGFRLVHDFVGEHATVPTDVATVLQDVAVLITQPVTGVMRDVELSIGIIRQAMPPRLVVAARPVNGRVVLGDVKVDGPGSQRVSQLF